MMVLAHVADLIFQSKIEATAHKIGVDVHVAREAEELLRLLSGAHAVILDLSTESADALELVRTIKQRQPETLVVGYLPHVQAERRKAALAAGADEVLPRSAFAARLPELLARLAN